MKTIYILLPRENATASSYVRALCLDGFWPPGWDVKFVHGPDRLPDCSLFRRFFVNYHYCKILLGYWCNKKFGCVYFIKPSSIVLLLLVRFVLMAKVIIDINDALHLPEHLGRHSRAKLITLLKISNGIVFESAEYREFCAKWHKTPSTVIEDTPQFEQSYLRFSDRELSAVWFGSFLTSEALLNYKEYFKVISESGFEIILLGAAPHVVDSLKHIVKNIKYMKVYNHQELTAILSYSTLSFVPMPSVEFYELRGNLKAKLSMATGCVTLASNLKMHQRLIDDKRNGYMFQTFEEFCLIIKKISNNPEMYLETIGRSANVKVMCNYNRVSHAKQICEFVETLN